ncbi:MAG: methyltransferase protein [Solirubrobacterales bacterium]|nr:methyltransferase protein [Solirubrobacterales bacterium]
MAADDLRARVAANEGWYHTIALPGGITTPGQVDLRTSAPKLLPDRLDGTRALDVGTFDGFWAFELERRGAETVAIDVEQLDHAQWPPLNRPRLRQIAAEWDMQLGRGFAIAHEALGSSVERVVTDVYDVTPEKIGGPVDTIFAGAIMVHLRDPVRALEALHACLKPGGVLIQMEHFSLRNTLLAPRRPTGDFQPLRSDFNWMLANLSLLKAWPWVAGFTSVERIGFLRPPSSSFMTGWYVGLRSRRSA